MLWSAAPPSRHRAPPCSKTALRPSSQQATGAKGEWGDKQVSYPVYFIRQRHQLTLCLFASFPSKWEGVRRRPWCRQRQTTHGGHGPSRCGGRVVPPLLGGRERTGHQKHDRGHGRGRGGGGGGRGGPAMVVALALGSQGGLSLGKPWPWVAMVVAMVGAVAVTWPGSCPWPWPWPTLWP